ncbi:erythrocyte membrane protein 1, PfEMP1, putative [Plasmodium sp. DRC-Itaito]|nr:erythrocyte membrane protein 1, PfEMP1, putative [Plasmodium sp. DRC-Itaito]
MRKPKPPVKLFSVLDIPKGEFDMPTLKSKNRYIPYSSGKHRGKRYIYIEGDTDEEKYAFMSDSTDITSSSESEYEEIDLHVPHVPKYKTLIEVVLEPSSSGKNEPNSDITLPTSDTTIPTGDNTIPTSDNTIPTSDIPSPISDDEWNELKQNFISQYLENEQKDVLQPDISKELPLNTLPNTLYFDKPEEKPFIMSIHDRNLHTAEEYSYDMLNSGNNDSYSGKNGPYSGNNDSYSGTNDPISDNPSSYSDNPHPYSAIDLINDSLSGTHDIYDEILKRKENELFGTNHVKNMSSYSVAKNTNSDPLHNQINLFHQWLDRHRDMCEKWNKNNSKEEMLDKLKEEWDKENISDNINPSDNIPSDILNGKLSDIPSGKLSDTPNHNNKHSDIPYVLNTDVSIEIDMDKPNHVENTNPMDQNPLLVENINPVDGYTPNPNSTKVQIELSVKNRNMAKVNFPIGDVWDI